MKTVYKLAIAVFSLALITGCGDDEFEKEIPNDVNINLGGELLQACQNCLITDENDPNNYYSRIDSVSQYGFGMYYTLPDSLKDCGLRLILSGKMRETESRTGYIAIAIHTTDSISYWGYVFSEHKLKELNKWANFCDTVKIPQNNNKATSRLLKIFQFKVAGKGYYDLDNLNVKISRL